GAKHLPEAAVGHKGVRSSKRRRIPGVQEVGPKLQLEPLRKLEVLGQTQIRVPSSVTPKLSNVTGRAADFTVAGLGPGSQLIANATCRTSVKKLRATVEPLDAAIGHRRFR